MARKGAAGTALAFAAVGWWAAEAGAQVPGAPVLQNAFSTPGLAIAADFGSGGGQSFYGLAASWGPGTGRIQLSAAAGAQRGNQSTRGAYGGRAAMSLWNSSGGSLGAGGFVGIGGAPRTRANSVVTNPALLNVPVGLSVGYRHAMGATRGISAYLSPLYRWQRSTAETSVTAGAFRLSAGLDFAISTSLGVTIGGEFGGRSGADGTNSIGAALSFVPGR